MILVQCDLVHASAHGALVQSREQDQASPADRSGKDLVPVIADLEEISLIPMNRKDSPFPCYTIVELTIVSNFCADQVSRITHSGSWESRWSCFQ